MPSQSIGLVRKSQQYYGNVCTLNGCNLPRMQGNKLCNHHKKVNLFRGAPDQHQIPRRDMNFAKKSVQLLIIDNQSNPSWCDLMTAIQDNWLLAQRAVNKELQLSATGYAMNKYRRNGLKICSAIFEGVGLEKAFITYCAFQWLQEWNSHQFKTDISFRHLLVRALRSQAKDFNPSDLNKTTGKPVVYSAPLYMNERDCVWEVMSSIFGYTGIKLYEQVSKRAERLRKNKNAINLAIKNIQ